MMNRLMQATNCACRRAGTLVAVMAVMMLAWWFIPAGSASSDVLESPFAPRMQRISELSPSESRPFVLARFIADLPTADAGPRVGTLQDDYDEPRGEKKEQPDQDSDEENETPKEGAEADDAVDRNTDDQAAEAKDKDDEQQDETDDKSTEKTAELELDGVFISRSATELSTEADELGSVKIEKVLAHGSVVRRGENVVWFETKEPDKKIDDAKTALRIAELDFADEELEYDQFTQTQQLDRQAADRALAEAKETYDNFIRIDRERQLETAKFDLKQAEAYLENAQEELEQLQQMYDEDDLTEESEEIVLKRAKQAVESAQFRLDGAEIRSQRTVEQQVPRLTEEQEETLRRAELSHERTLAKQKLTVERQQIELAKQQQQVEMAEEKLADLREQRKRLVLSAPHHGIVIHGALTRGRLGNKPSQLEAGSMMPPSQVVVTIIDPSELAVLIDVPEDKIARVSKGVAVEIVPTAESETTLSGAVEEVSTIAHSGTQFSATVSVDLDDNDAIRPTMTCKVKIPEPDDE